MRCAMFADDIVICSESRQHIGESLEANENGKNPSGTVRSQGVEVKEVKAFQLKSQRRNWQV